MESKLEGSVNYLQFVDCTLDAAKQNATTVATESLFRPIYRPIYKNDQPRRQKALALMPPLVMHGAIR